SLVDTFLHARDRAYTVGQCLELVSGAGLAFQGWDENSFYYPEGPLPASHPLRSYLAKLPLQAQWQAQELLAGNLTLHYFHVCRADRPEEQYKIDFDGERFLDYVPVPRVAHYVPADPSAGKPASIARPPFPPIHLNEYQAHLYRQIDGQRTVA